MTARRQAAVQPGRYGLRSAVRGLAVSFRVSIMARAGRGQNGSSGRAAQMRRTDRHTAIFGGTGGRASGVAVQVDMRPAQGPGLLGADLAQQAQHNVSVHQLGGPAAPGDAGDSPVRSWPWR